MTKKPLPPTAPLTRNLIFTGGTYHKNAEMPKDAAHHKQQRAILANNIFVQISSQNPTMMTTQQAIALIEVFSPRMKYVVATLKTVVKDRPMK